MPTRIRSLACRSILQTTDGPYICPSCIVHQRKAHRPAWSRSRARPASHLVSSTAINATKTIPARCKPLYDALNVVKKTAYAQVNLSRLQLAIQGLETEAPMIRVAILGLNVPDTARRLVRLLLADALERDQGWEQRVISDVGSENYGQGLLIRYGEAYDTSLPRQQSVIPVLRIPADALSRNNVEILVSAISSRVLTEANFKRNRTTSDVFLSPTVGTPSSHGGRQSMISLPVHKALLVAKDLNELVKAAELFASTDFLSPTERQMAELAVNLAVGIDNRPGGLIVVDLEKAEEGLNAIRTSTKEATTYEHKWMESGMKDLSIWLSLASAKSAAGLPRLVRDLILSLLDAASMNLKKQEADVLALSEKNAVPENTRTSLERAITRFSSQAHAELQSSLAAAWSSRNWRKLAWYKLFWRADDISLIVTDLVNNAWLPRAEQSVYELSGRFVQAGITTSSSDEVPAEMQVIETQESKEVEHVPMITTPARGVSMGAMAVNVPTTGEKDTVIQQGQVEPPSFVTKIPAMRRNYISQSVTDMTVQAQQIVFRTLTIFGASGGLSGLAYFSVTSGNVYESATIIALGTAYALRTMQGGWQSQCRRLQVELSEAGRAVLQQTEKQMRDLARHGGKREEHGSESDFRRQAADAVEKARQALEELS